MISIYVLCDPKTDEIRYVGMSRNPKRRHRQYCAERGGHTKHFQHWLESIGRQPRMRILEIVDASIADECERQWISYFRSIGVRLINYTTGGEGGFVHGAEVKAKIRRSQEQRLQNGTHNFQDPKIRAKSIAAVKATKGTSKPWSRAQALRLVELHRGKPLNEEHKRKCSIALTGKVRSPEVREQDRLRALERMRNDPVYAEHTRTMGKHGNHSHEGILRSAAERRGIPLTPEHRAKVSIAMKGRRNDGLKAYWDRTRTPSHPMTPEIRAKISASLKGRPRPAGLTAYWAAKKTSTEGQIGVPPVDLC